MRRTGLGMRLHNGWVDRTPAAPSTPIGQCTVCLLAEDFGLPIQGELGFWEQKFSPLRKVANQADEILRLGPRPLTCVSSSLTEKTKRGATSGSSGTSFKWSWVLGPRRTNHSLPGHMAAHGTIGGTLVRQARAGHLFGPVPHRWPFRVCTKGARLAQCSYLGAWLY